MTKFGLYTCGEWRDGEMPKVTPIYVVNYDQRNIAYQVERRDYGDFIDWVAQTWERSDDLIGEDETSADYLDRRGIHVRELSWK